MKQNWREAATLIILARDVCKNSKFDYKVLVFKRTDKTSFMPNSICFPGGSIDSTDESKDWINHFNKFKIDSEELRKEFSVNSSLKSFIFNNNDESKLTRGVSLRLNAIRETFEELGIVLCEKDLEEIKSKSPFSKSNSECNNVEWQHKVHSQKESFLSFCENYNVLPDLWNIYEWSAWLTPTNFESRRFETAFFIAALNEIPEVHPESEHEVAEYMWETPENLLDQYQKEKLWLPPPQIYELTRLSQIHSLDEVVNHAEHRKNKGITLFMPIYYMTSEGSMFVLPGDELYPENPNYEKTAHSRKEHINKSFHELRSMCKKWNRVEFKDFYNYQLICNIPGCDGHKDLIGFGMNNKAKL